MCLGPDLDLFDQVPHDVLAVLVRGLRRLPQGGNILGQALDQHPFRCAQIRRLAAFEARVVLLECAFLQNGLFPALFQFPGHQAVLRLDRMVLPRGRSFWKPARCSRCRHC